MRTVHRLSLSFFVYSVIACAMGCNFLDHAANKGVFGPIALEQFLDQGYVYFDDTGNVKVVLNNTMMRGNPMFNATSFVAVWVFQRGANPYSRCCSGSGCPATEAMSCVQGFGFSNDLGFAGSSSYDLHPPEPFNPNLDRYYIPVWAATSDAVPMSYQGAYTELSSPTGIVSDRQQFDLYVGLFYTIVHPDVQPHRVSNQKKTVNGVDLYTPIDPDWLSPVIPIEARFYPQSQDDPPGSMYVIPHILTWTPHGEIDHFRDYRNLVILNELVGNPNGVDGNAGSPELVEIYNRSSYNVDLYGWRISITGANSVDLGITSGTTCLSSTKLPPGGYLTLAYYVDSTQANLDPAADCDFSDGIARLKVPGVSGMTTGTGSARLYSDASSTLVDYVQFTTAACSTSQTGLSSAVSAGIWTSGDCVAGNDYIRRLPNATETNRSTDWAGNTIPPGIPTPGAANN